jgi:hypothetical protein
MLLGAGYRSMIKSLCRLHPGSPPGGQLQFSIPNEGIERVAEREVAKVGWGLIFTRVTEDCSSGTQY